MTESFAVNLIKKEFKTRYGVSYGEWSMQHKDNAILAADLTGNIICLTICGILPPEIRKTKTMTVNQFEKSVKDGNFGAALADMKQSLASWQKVEKVI